MKTIRILKLHERFFGPNRLTLDEAARAMSKRTGYSIVPINLVSKYRENGALSS